MRSASHRIAGAVAVALFAGATVVQPFVHLASHGTPHRHGPNASDIDLAALVDPASGRVDLTRLAQELGLENGAHAEAHRRSVPHQHGTQSPSHGAGSLEHLHLAILTPPPIAPTPAIRRVEFSQASVADHADAPLRLIFLASQRAQAPPA